MKATIYAGTYTSSASKGIYRFTYEDGILKDPELFCAIQNPKYLCAFEGKIAAVCDLDEGSGVALIDRSGNIADALAFEKECSCYITGRDGSLFTANYHAGTFSVLTYKNNKLELLKTVGIQKKGGCHQVLFHEDEILIPCLFLDQLRIYDKDLNCRDAIAFPKGSGPRHGTFSKDKRTLYLVSELSNELFVIDVEKRQITRKTDLLENDERNIEGTAAIRMSEDGRYLYASTRGRDVISVFDLKDDLNRLQVTSCLGSHPRDFILCGEHLLCANRLSNEVVSLKIQDGRITKEVCRIEIPEAISLLEMN